MKFRDSSLNRSRKIPHKAAGGGILDSIFRYNFRPEDDVISSVDVDNVGMDVCVKFGDSKSNGFRDIRGADFVSNERTNMTKPIPIERQGVSPNNYHNTRNASTTYM